MNVGSGAGLPIGDLRELRAALTIDSRNCFQRRTYLSMQQLLGLFKRSRLTEVLESLGDVPFTIEDG